MESPIALDKKDASIILCGQAGQGIQTQDKTPLSLRDV